MAPTPFHRLAAEPHPYALGNVWDVPSARAAEAAGFPALGTSSAALASVFGYADGEGLPFADLYRVIERIRACVALPLSVDLEHGYAANDVGAADHALALAELGVAGINLEDSVVTADARALVPAERFAARLRAVRQALDRAGHACFVNARSDGFLLGHPAAREESLRRSHHYTAAGADGLFLPGIVAVDDICAVTSSSPLPLNVLALPGLPAWDTLAEAGVNRVSSGNFGQDLALASLGRAMVRLAKHRDVTAIYS